MLRRSEIGQIVCQKMEYKLQLAISLSILGTSISDKHPSVALSILAWYSYNKVVAFTFHMERVVYLSVTEYDQKCDA